MERRIEPDEKARFSLEVRNTFEELSITNVNITAAFTPSGSISLTSVAGDSPSRVIPPYGEGKYVLEIQTLSTPVGDYKMDIRFDYDLIVPSTVSKFSQESLTITVVPD